MKSYWFCLVLFLIASDSFSQNFEGTIVYENSYKSKDPNVTDEQWKAMIGARQTYAIKGGNYKTSMSGTLFQWQLYTNADNKIYMKGLTSPAVFWQDARVNPDTVKKAEINKSVVTILGHLCDELVLTTKTGIQKYYFSPKLKVDADLYQNHKFGNFSEYVARAKSLPLKIILETPQFIMESVATEITSRKLSDAEFELPPNSQLQKNPGL